MTSAIQLLCSTGALSHFPDSTGYQAVLEYGPQLDVDGFELMFYPNWYSHIETIAHDLKKSGLAFPAMHTDKNIGTALGKADETERQQGIRWFEENCQLGKLLGTQILVLHLWGWPELDDHLARNLAYLPTCLAIAEHYAVQVAIETIPCRQATPIQNVLQAIAHDPRSQIALDTEFLANYQQLESVFTTEQFWQNQRTRHVHVKDSDGHPFSQEGKRKYLHPGDGNIDFTLFFEHLKQQGFRGNVSLEAPAIEQGGKVRIERLRASLKLLRNFLD